MLGIDEPPPLDWLELNTEVPGLLPDPEPEGTDAEKLDENGDRLLLGLLDRLELELELLEGVHGMT